MKKNKNNILIISILLAIILMIAIILLKTGKTKVDIIGGKEEKYLGTCSECGWPTWKSHDDSSHYETCIKGHHQNVESHSLSDRKVTDNPSYNKCWYVLRECSGCGYSKEIESGDHARWKGGYYDRDGVWHNVNDVWDGSGEATCTESIRYERECLDCGYEDSYTVGPYGHDYKEVDTGDGKTHKFVCTRCKEEKKENNVLVTEAHTYSESVQNQTCVNSGGITEECTKCKYKYTKEKYNATGHKFGIGYH